MRLEAPRPVLSSQTPPSPVQRSLLRYQEFRHKNSQLWLKNSWEYSQLQQLGIFPCAGSQESVDAVPFDCQLCSRPSWGDASNVPERLPRADAHLLRPRHDHVHRQDGAGHGQSDLRRKQASRQRVRDEHGRGVPCSTCMRRGQTIIYSGFRFVYTFR